MKAYTEADMVGKVFGYWTVVGFAGSKSGKRMWLCKCVCGAERELQTSLLTLGESQQCRKCAAKTFVARRKRAAATRRFFDE